MSLVQSAGPAKLERSKVERLFGAAPSPTRILDVTMAGIGLVVLAPVMLLIALAIYVTEGRPIFFAQPRLGQRAIPFRMYKFRKFRRDCGTNGRPVTLKNDPRMTPLGALLEKSKLDELPQLWNILKGDMSVVGPRPESLDLASCFTVEYMRVLDYKPGIFGPNQFQFRNEGALYAERVDPERYYREVLFPAKARADLAYFPHRTILADAGWIVRGVWSVLGLGRPPQDNLESCAVTVQATATLRPPRADGGARS